MAIRAGVASKIVVLVMVTQLGVTVNRAVAADTLVPPQLPASVGNVSHCPETGRYVDATNKRLGDPTRDLKATAEAFVSLGRAALSCASRLQRASSADVPQAWISAGTSLSTAADLYGYLSKTSGSAGTNYTDLCVSTAHIAYVVLSAAKRDSNDVMILETTTEAIARIVAIMDRYAPNRLDEVTGTETPSPP